ncbi:MAG TPA: DNA adenine methylase [Gemmataceae bacterium]|nr:DNA adenine methylase [Gemmataceae bacterium]
MSPSVRPALFRQPPSTRYQGSKLKLLPWLAEQLARLEFHTVLDAFGGTGSVSYLLKAQGKAVTCNDYLRCNYQTATALIENRRVRLSEDDVRQVLRRDPETAYDDFISRTFRDIYFTAAEDRWLDTVCQNIPRLPGRYRRALAYHALFQACLIKRPYNLFHRKNLYLRTAQVARSFGNKASWDAPFEEHFRRFVAEANAAVFDSGSACRALCRDALEVPGNYDLVYIDPPYLNRRGVGVDYLQFYHFLEGITDYARWGERIDYRRPHRPLRGPRSPWSDPRCIHAAFARLFERFADSILVVSYRSDGIPSEEELAALLGRVKRSVTRVKYGEYQYALSTNTHSDEVLLIGQ